MSPSLRAYAQTCAVNPDSTNKADDEAYVQQEWLSETLAYSSTAPGTNLYQGASSWQDEEVR
jgi:hypothetical protein